MNMTKITHKVYRGSPSKLIIETDNQQILIELTGENKLKLADVIFGDCQRDEIFISEVK